MNSKYAQEKLNHLDHIFSTFEIEKLSELAKGYIAKYLTVMTSGVYQDIIQHLLIE